MAWKNCNIMIFVDLVKRTLRLELTFTIACKHICVLFKGHAGGSYMANIHTVYPKKYAHGFVVLCFVVVMQSFIMNSHEVFIHIHQGCFAGTGAIVRLPQCQWSKPDEYGKISQCITTTKHTKAKTVCIFLGIYCNLLESNVAVIILCMYAASLGRVSKALWNVYYMNAKRMAVIDT